MLHTPPAPFHPIHMMFDLPTLRRIAVAAESTDERTVAAYLNGRTVRPSSAERIERGLRRLGLDEFVRAVSTAEALRVRNGAP